jgi:tetratricopeptide (TPR) repeat protein
VSARVILGKCFYDKGASERAKTEFEKAIELDPENMVALKFLGDIHLAEDDRERAAGYYEKLLAIDPANKEIKKIREEITKEFKPVEIDLNDDESIENTDASSEPATMTLAGIYAAQGYYAKAINIYRSVLKDEPDNVEARKMLDKLEAMSGSSDDAGKEAFKDDVMTISLDDISEEIGKGTSGSGGAGEFPDEEYEDTPSIAEDDGDALDSAEMLEREDIRSSEEDRLEGGVEKETLDPSLEEDGEEVEGDNLRNFMGWIKKVKDKGDEEPPGE